MSHSNDEESTKPPLSRAAGSQWRIRWYLVIFGFFLAVYVLFRLPTHDQDAAKTARTETTARALAMSVESFFNEYGYLPVPEKEGSSLDLGFVTDEEPGVEVLRILMGKDQDRNPRGVPFLKPHEGKDRKGGLIHEESTGKVTGMFDPWGNPYQMVFDSDYNEEIVVNIMGKPETVKGQHVLVYSAGKDRKLGTADDVRSW